MKLRIATVSYTHLDVYKRQDYNQALAMADSSRQLTRKSKDTLAYFTASQLYLQIIEVMQQHEKYTQGYKKLIEARCV